ncbi:MAG TPA: SPOR domain-containing protein, partial [Prolixibacteraceae bacterium]|nr:SPOR domain-containing protein [Prolixibacteraceae bacterium]
ENMKVYVLFQSPDFKVRVGDFRTKSEALKLRNQLKNEFPSVFIIDDLISLPEIDESKAGL